MPSPEEAPRPSPPKPPTVRDAHQRRDPPPPQAARPTSAHLLPWGRKPQQGEVLMAGRDRTGTEPQLCQQGRGRHDGEGGGWLTGPSVLQRADASWPRTGSPTQSRLWTPDSMGQGSLAVPPCPASLRAACESLRPAKQGPVGLSAHRAGRVPWRSPSAHRGRGGGRGAEGRSADSVGL